VVENGGNTVMYAMDFESDFLYLVTDVGAPNWSTLLYKINATNMSIVDSLSFS
jgi:hypothetical protein